MIFCLNFVILIMGMTVILIFSLITFVFPNENNTKQIHNECIMAGTGSLYFVINFFNVLCLKKLLSSYLKGNVNLTQFQENSFHLKTTKRTFHESIEKKSSSVPIYLVFYLFIFLLIFFHSFWQECR